MFQRYMIALFGGCLGGAFMAFAYDYQLAKINIFIGNPTPVFIKIIAIVVLTILLVSTIKEE